MCGFNGVYFVDSLKEINRPLFEAALQAMAHRGPDNHGVHIQPGLALGHNRLSIIDTSAQANQPFFSADKRHILVFNGEIFNYRQLKNELEAGGHVFRTNSDTEVLLQLLVQYGIASLHRINGFFAFAWYDSHSHQLIIARDRFGEKPLFYSYNKDKKSLCFASELKGVLPFMAQKNISPTALKLLLHLTYIPAPHTILSDVLKLAPGTYAVISQSSFQLKTWYSLTGYTLAPQHNEAAVSGRLRELFDTAVARRMVSDVPVAGFLSGGIDSSLVSAVAHKLNPGYETFSVGFSGNSFMDETGDAVFAANHFGIKHNVVRLHEDEMLENVSDILGKVDEPFGDSSMIALYSLCKKIKGSYKVILSGDGADEVFGGYNKHYALWMAGKKNVTNALVKNLGGAHALFPKSRNSKIANKARQLQKMHAMLNQTGFDRYWFLAGFNSAMSGPILPGYHNEIQAFKQQLQQQANTGNFNDYLLYDMLLVLPNDMLYKVDMASMHNGMEIRSPFMDHELIEYAFTIDGSYKLKNGTGKYLLRQAFAGLLPPRLLQKPKHGFEVPLQQWLTGPLQHLTNAYLSPEYVQAQGIFNASAISNLLKKMHSSNPGDTASTVWSLLNVQMACKNYNYA